MSDLEWHGDDALAMVRKRAVGFIRRACYAVKARAKELLSIPGTAQGRDGKGKFKRITGAVRSAPGEPPRKQTGRLRASVDVEVDDASMTGRVGTNVKYGKDLELGTKRGIKPRPWLRRALAEEQTKVNDLLGQIGDQS